MTNAPKFPLAPAWFAVSVALVLVSPAGVRAAPAPQSATGTIVLRGDPSRGVPACSSCHGDHGQGNRLTGYPRLAGLPAPYLGRQLQAFAAGRRQNPIMAPIAARLTRSDRIGLAKYYAGLPLPHPAATGHRRTSIDGKQLADYGRVRDRLPACTLCHGRNGVGVGGNFPALAGQPAAYIAGQLRAWQRHARPGGPMNLMATVAGKLSPSDIHAVAAYFSGLPADWKRPR